MTGYFYPWSFGDRKKQKQKQNKRREDMEVYMIHRVHACELRKAPTSYVKFDLFKVLVRLRKPYEIGRKKFMMGNSVGQMAQLRFKQNRQWARPVLLSSNAAQSVQYFELL